MPVADQPTEGHKIESRGVYSRQSNGDIREGAGGILQERPPHVTYRVSAGLPAFYP